MTIDIATMLRIWILQRPALLREFSLQMKNRPLIQAGTTTLVLGHKQVLDILSRENDFHLADDMRGRILSGPFLLSTEPPGDYLKDKADMCEAVFGAAELMEGIASLAAHETNARLRQAQGHIDVVGDLLEPIATLVVQKFLIGPDNQTIPDTELLKALRKMAELIVIEDPKDEKLIREVAVATRHVESLVEDRLALAPSQSMDMTERLRGVIADDQIPRLVAGLAGTATATIARAGGQAVNELLYRPEQLKSARIFAQQGDKSTILQFVLEGLRFNPMFSFTPRTAVRDVFVDGGEAPFKIAANSKLAVGLLPAMFDSSAFPEPRKFLINRPRESYLHFGYGYHRCFGGPIAELELSEIFTQLLSVQNLCRDRFYSLGRLRYDWPALRHLHVRWDS